MSIQVRHLCKGRMLTHLSRFQTCNALFSGVETAQPNVKLTDLGLGKRRSPSYEVVLTLFSVCG